MRRLLAVLLVSLSSAVPAAPLIVGVSDGNYNALRVENGRFHGSLSRRYQCAFERLGLDYEFRSFPQVRVLHLLERGGIDVGLPLVEVSDRNDYARFTAQMYEVPFLLYSRHQIEPGDDISQYTFVIRRTGASYELLQRRRARFEEVNDWAQALDLARLGRFDGTVIPAQVASSFGPDDFGELKKSLFGTMPLSMYVSKQSPMADELFARLNAAIAGCPP